MVRTDLSYCLWNVLFHIVVHFSGYFHFFSSSTCRHVTRPPRTHYTLTDDSKVAFMFTPETAEEGPFPPARIVCRPFRAQDRALGGESRQQEKVVLGMSLCLVVLEGWGRHGQP